MSDKPHYFPGKHGPRLYSLSILKPKMNRPASVETGLSMAIDVLENNYGFLSAGFALAAVDSGGLAGALLDVGAEPLRY